MTKDVSILSHDALSPVITRDFVGMNKALQSAANQFTVLANAQLPSDVSSLIAHRGHGSRNDNHDSQDFTDPTTDEELKQSLLDAGLSARVVERMREARHSSPQYVPIVNRTPRQQVLLGFGASEDLLSRLSSGTELRTSSELQVLNELLDLYGKLPASTARLTPQYLANDYFNNNPTAFGQETDIKVQQALISKHLPPLELKLMMLVYQLGWQNMPTGIEHVKQALFKLGASETLLNQVSLGSRGSSFLELLTLNELLDTYKRVTGTQKKPDLPTLTHANVTLADIKSADDLVVSTNPAASNLERLAEFNHLMAAELRDIDLTLKRYEETINSDFIMAIGELYELRDNYVLLKHKMLSVMQQNQLFAKALTLVKQWGDHNHDYVKYERIIDEIENRDQAVFDFYHHINQQLTALAHLIDKHNVARQVQQQISAESTQLNIENVQSVFDLVQPTNPQTNFTNLLMFIGQLNQQLETIKNGFIEIQKSFSGDGNTLSASEIGDQKKVLMEQLNLVGARFELFHKAWSCVEDWTPSDDVTDEHEVIQQAIQRYYNIILEIGGML